MEVSVIVPAYNSADSLAELVRRLDAELSKITTDFELILVNDGSRVAIRRDRSTPPASQVRASNYTFRKLLVHLLNMMTGFSTLPLQIVTYVGFSFTLVGIGVLAFVVGRFLLRGDSVAGFQFLASIVAIFSGAQQLFALGIIGEYLARMYVRTLEQPAYMIRETKGK